MRLDTPTVLQHTIVRCYLTGVAQTSGGLKRASRLRSRSRRHRSRSRRWSSLMLTWESPPPGTIAAAARGAGLVQEHLEF